MANSTRACLLRGLVRSTTNGCEGASLLLVLVGTLLGVSRVAVPLMEGRMCVSTSLGDDD